MNDKSAAILGVVGTFLALTWIAVFLRLYVRAFILKRMQLADYFIIFTEISSTCEAVFVFIGVHGGIGNSNFDPTLGNIASALRNQLIIELLFCITSTLLRVSIGLQLWPLVKLQNVSQRYIILAITSIIVAYGIAWFFALLFQCVPTDFFWNRALEATKGSCLSNDTEAGLAYTQAILSALSDIILGLLPVWILWGVHMPRRTKITVSALLGAGILAGIAAIVRLVYTKHLIFASNDFFGDPVPVILCAFLELSLGILATCIATFRPLFVKTAKFFHSNSTNSRSTKQESNQLDLKGREVRQVDHRNDHGNQHIRVTTEVLQISTNK